MFQRLKNGGWPYSQPPNVPFKINKDSPQSEGLIAWYPTLGSRGANVLRDYAGRGLDGAFPGGAANPSWVGDAERGMVLDFDGGDDYIRIPDNADFSVVVTNELTVSLWAKPRTVAENDYLVIKGNEDVAGQWEWGIREIGEIGNTSWTVWTQGGGDVLTFTATGNQFTSGVWHHVVMTIDYAAPALRGYIDGVEVGSDVSLGASPPGSASSAIALGPRSGSGYFDDLMDDLRIHNVALSPAVIWDMAHDKKGELYRPVRRLWAVKLPIGWQSVFGGRGMSPIGSAVIRPGVVL